MAPTNEDEVDDSPGLIDLDMKEFGSGAMNDPLRHAMGLRSAQDACKMRMWNSFPMLFQNTIFHGEQDASIKEMRHHKPLSDRLARAKELKELGNADLKSASSFEPPPASACAAETPSAEEKKLADQLVDIDKTIVEKETELRELRKQRNALKKTHDRLKQDREGDNRESACIELEGTPFTKKLEAAITNYEKAAGILFFVECIRTDWKNDDGSYKGIEDEWLKVDSSAFEGDTPEAEQAKEMVTSCYLNIALASQKLGKFDQMKAACDEILNKVNSKHVKALYRRAQAHIAPMNSTDADMEAAIQDLHTAAQLDPQNKDVRSLHSKLKAERKAQISEDRSKFAGLFDRGQVVTNDPRSEGDKQEIDPSKLDIRDPKVQRMLDIRLGPGDY